ncbi:MAG: hypothetical protein ACOCR1_02375 [Planctomycetota bacterium]
MADEGLETFEVTSEESADETQIREETPMNSNSFLHVTIVDHNPVIEGTDDSSYIDVRIPIAMVEAGLHTIPEEKFGTIDPDMIVQMVEMGAEGELIQINEERKSINIRVE